ncbi:DEP domain-containing mTOR-interacting protein-like [Asterias rubens]|uniref:DEP domain-containing mTOR-interacting protein-like n=1 Tax=Asterias rubens TaxID=7604 RepID=UPI0014558864|nr:DEP domain-containing mTOR-interacting protein-like [Asterias rubens]
MLSTHHRKSTGQLGLPLTKPHRTSSLASISTRTFGKILIIGEKLRLSFHSCDPAMVKDRRHHLRMYPKSFIGNEAVDWLIKNIGVKDRPTATLMLNILQSHNVVHHVCDDHTFKDAYLFYRFRVDDGTLPQSRDTELYIKSHQLYHELTQLGNSSIMKVHNELGNMYDKSFYGTQLVNWLVKNRSCSSRQEAVGLGKDLLENDLIRHVTTEHHFKDERHLYQFHPELARLKVIDLLELDDRPRSVTLDTNTVAHPKTKSHTRPSPTKSLPDSPVIAPANPKFYLGNGPEQDDNMNSAMLERNAVSESDSEDLSTSSGSQDNHMPTMFGQQNPSVAMLLDPESPYVKRTIKIIGDSVGFGFVVRGDGPSFVQTVDPTGPAAAAGLKVKQYLYFVNGEYVLNKNHIEVAHIILRNTQLITMDVLMPRNQAYKK